jgi:ankyrin repeat protein
MGAQIDNGGSEGITPLMWAAKRDNAFMVSILLENGADVT